MKVYTLQDDLKYRMKNPKFKKAWKESEAEYLMSKALIEARLKKKISQRALAKRANTTQAVISRIESMDGNPSIQLLQRIAVALNLKLKIQFS